MKKYRVLIVDDKKECLETAERVINYSLEDWRMLKDWRIEIKTAHVRVEKINDTFRIEKGCIIEMAELLREPFDLLLLDFSYKEKNVNLKSVMEKNNTLAEFEKHVLNPSTLAHQGCIYLKKNPDGLLKCFVENFVNFSKNIYVCTCVTEEDREKILPVSIRGNPKQYCKNIVAKKFTKAIITVKDTREEIFNSTEFQEIKNFRDEKKEGGSYYDFILAKYLEQLILLDIAEKEIDDAKHIKTSILLGENQPIKTMSNDEQNKREITEDRINKKVLFWTIVGVVVAVIIGIVSNWNKIF